MKQFLTILTVSGALFCATSTATASLPDGDTVALTSEADLLAPVDETSTLLAQCYGGGGYYRAPVRTYSYYRARPGVSINIGGGGYRGGYYGRPGFYGGRYPYRGGFGPGFYGPGIGFGGRSGVGVFLRF